MISSTFLYQKKKNKFAVKLSLVALMDIFTILVFFLLINSGETQEIEYTRYVTLPDSSTGIAPHQDLVVLIGETDIWLEEQSIAKVSDIMEEPGEVIAALAAALDEHTEKKTELTPFEEEKGLSVTIMGDRAVPYFLLKSVMATCRLKDYRNISLAVTQVVSNNLVPVGASGTTTVTNSSTGS